MEWSQYCNGCIILLNLLLLEQLLLPGGGGATSVCYFLSSSGLDSPPFWGGDMVFFRGDVQESGGGTRGFTKKYN